MYVDAEFFFFVESTRNMAFDAAPEDALCKMVKSVVPRMAPDLYKGQSGRIAVIGGCKE